jgi:hypothetical protein
MDGAGFAGAFGGGGGFHDVTGCLGIGSRIPGCPSVTHRKE